jgi:hypothetical protein
MIRRLFPLPFYPYTPHKSQTGNSPASAELSATSGV